MHVLTGLSLDELKPSILCKNINKMKKIFRGCTFGEATYFKMAFLQLMLKVESYIGEQSVDDGGPRREFFQLLMRECFSKSGLFRGWPCNTVPAHNVEAVADNKYYIVGKMVSMCIVQGGQPPLCFAEAIADFDVYIIVVF